LICQPKRMMQLLRVAPQHPVQKADRVDGVEFQILLAFGQLCRVGIAGVVDNPLDQSGEERKLNFDVVEGSECRTIVPNCFDSWARQLMAKEKAIEDNCSTFRTYLSIRREPLLSAPLATQRCQQCCLHLILCILSNGAIQTASNPDSNFYIFLPLHFSARTTCPASKGTELDTANVIQNPLGVVECENPENYLCTTLDVRPEI
jgi:hypothetical protein